MAPHSSTLAWKIPWTEEPGRLQSMGSGRVGYNWATSLFTFHFSLSCIREGNGNRLLCSCLENPRDGGAWWAAVYGVAQSRTRLKRLSSSSMVDVGLPPQLSGKESACSAGVGGDACSIPGSGRSLEEVMATHSNILAQRILWTEELGGLQSMGSQRVRNDWSNLAYTEDCWRLRGPLSLFEVSHPVECLFMQLLSLSD